LPIDGGQVSSKGGWPLPNGEAGVKGQFSLTAVLTY
jgi:hypothetical protein